MRRTDPPPQRPLGDATTTGRLGSRLCKALLVAVLIGGCGFAYKLVAFAREALTNEAVSFTWAMLRGQFRDVEAPKYRLLEAEERYDRAGI